MKDNIKSVIRDFDKKSHGLASEFKTFISRGNVVDLAVGLIIGSAFTQIVTALTQNIIMPFINYLISLITNGKNIELITILNNEPRYVEVDGITTINEKCLFINWSSFIEAIFNFFLIALVIFIFIKIVNAIHINVLNANVLLRKKEIEEELKRKEKEKVEKEKQVKIKMEEDEKKAHDKTTNELLVEVINLLSNK